MNKHPVIFWLVLVGCGHAQLVGSPHSAPIAALGAPTTQSGMASQPGMRPPLAAVQGSASEWTRTVEHVVSELCNGQASSPSQQTVVIDGTRVQQPCGLVAMEFHPDAFARFAAESCKENPEAPSVDCYRLWYGAFITRVLQRYSHADLRSFPPWCESHSDECDDLRAAEIWFLNSHSSGLRAAYAQSQQRQMHSQR